MTQRIDFHSPDAYVLNCSTLLTEHPVLERAAAARAAGFSTVEFWWPFDGEAAPSGQQVDAFIASLEENNLTLGGLNFWAGHMAGGDRGTVSTIGAQDDFRKNVEIVVEIGRQTGCKLFNALYGLRQEDQDAAAQDELAVENLIHAARAVQEIGGTVLVEPVSGAEGYPLKSAEDAVAVIEKVKAAGVENIALLADFFHLSVNGDDVAAVIEKHAASFGHIQIADAPGRGAPGTGELPLEDWINRSFELGYQGPVALEYKQEQETAFNWLTVPATQN